MSRLPRKPSAKLRIEGLESREAPSMTPVASVVKPTSVSFLQGVAPVVVQASDDVGVTRVDFYLDYALHVSATQSPYGWSYDTRASVNGSHLLQAVAYDADGNSAVASI